jgi:hypothetical protein
MTKDTSTGDRINAVVSGPVQGAVAIGKNITQRQQVGAMELAPSEAERAELTTIFANLRAEVAEAVPESEHAAAMERIAELEQALLAGAPDLTTMQYVKQWFARKLPAAAALVASVFVHPLVGAIVERAGGNIADSLT